MMPNSYQQNIVQRMANGAKQMGESAAYLGNSTLGSFNKNVMQPMGNTFGNMMQHNPITQGINDFQRTIVGNLTKETNNKNQQLKKINSLMK